MNRFPDERLDERGPCAVGGNPVSYLLRNELRAIVGADELWSLEQTGEAIDADLEINAAGQITQVGGAPLNGASGGLDGVINLTVTVTDGEFEDSFDLVLDGFVTVA